MMKTITSMGPIMSSPDWLYQCIDTIAPSDGGGKVAIQR
jgi:hypothetical protein